MHRFRAGKPEGLASKNLEGKRFEDQVKVLDAIQKPEFKALLDRNIKSPKPEQAISKTLLDYFDLYKDKDFGINNKDLTKIGQELAKEFQFGKITPLKVASKVARSIELPNELNNIEAKYGLPELKTGTPWTYGDIVKGQARSYKIAKHLTEKYGVGAFEALMLRGESGGAGIGQARTLKDLQAGIKNQTLRYAIFENVGAVNKMLERVYGEIATEKNTTIDKLKKYEGISQRDSDIQGIKNSLFKRIVDKNGNWDYTSSKKQYEFGEKNKEVLKDVVDLLADLYDKNIIDHRQVRQWVEMHAGSMQGLIKKSASLAVLPEGKKAELEKIYGKEWVLEHTTPAKYAKARIYDYILSGKNPRAKENLDLTIRDMHTTFIPEKLDKMVNKILQENLPSNHLPGMDPLFSRYYLASHISDFNLGLNNFITGKKYRSSGSLSVKELQQYGQALKQYNSNLLPKEFKALASRDINSNINDALKNIEKATAQGNKKKKKKRGMSTWDFDDTLAFTKSGVRYTLPNPSGKPQPRKKVIFMAGGAGSGKSSVIKGLKLQEQGFKVVNQDISLEWLMKNHGLPKDMREFTSEQRSKFGSLSHQARGIAMRKRLKFQGKGDGVIVDGTGASLKSMEKLVKEFKDKGYDAQMVFVETSKDVSISRNKARKERSLQTNIVSKNWDSVMANKEPFKKLFGERFAEINTDKLKQNDPMPPELISKLDAFTKGYIKDRLNAGEFADRGAKILEQGGKFDFSEFNKVVGGEQGPFFKKALDRAKKYGTKNQYILTARPPEAQIPIYEFLKSQGLNIPLENIKCLGNSTAEAKAMWMLKKFSEGYNDMYFADDAIQNVKEVKHVLNQLDIKSKVQQALASRDLNRDFNKILEDKTGVSAEKTYKAVTARMEGSKKGKYKWIIPPSAADFELLTHYAFSGKGKKGEADMKFFEDNLSKPFAKGINAINTAKQKLTEDYLALRKIMPEARKMLNKKVPGTKFTHDAAIRVDRWTKAGYEVPGLSKKDFKILQDVMKSKPELTAYSEALGKISKQEKGWIPPTEHWLAENITADLNNINNKVNRAKYLEQWIENKNIIFSEQNLNKIEAIYGSRHREALEDMLYRMETGSNRTAGVNRLTNAFMNWTNNSVGAVMFLNMRSAELQMLSAVNYINWAENNPLRAGLAFANQPQYWKDFTRLYNSDMLKQRRAGLKMNVNEAEIAAAVEGSSNKAAAALSWLLKKGFTPTQVADSFAIASGGATFYRNRIKMYEKQGLDIKTAEKRAFRDFQEIAEKTQQSARPDLISMQQASALGRLILAFANTPMQYARIMKKSSMDLAAGRGDAKAHISKIAFYGAIQSMIFAGLQSGSFAMLFDDELAEDEEFKAKKWDHVTGTMTDGLLRGLGVGGASVSAIKNATQTFMEENNKDWNADYDKVWIDLLNVSPPIGSKVRKLKSAGNTYQWNKDVISKMGWDIDNPGIYAAANVVSATTNAPLDRFFIKLDNLRGAADVNNEAWQRVAMFGGYSRWSLGMDKPESVKKIKEEIKEEKKIKSQEKTIKEKETKLKEKYPGKSDKEIKKIVELEQKNKQVFDLNKREQVKILEANNLNPKNYPKEKDRVEAIMNLRSKNERKIDSTLTAIKEYVPTENEQRSIELFKMTKKDQVNLLMELGVSSKVIRSLKYEEDRVKKIMQLQKKVKKQ